MLNDGVLPQYVLPIVGGLISLAISLGIFGYFHSRHRVMTRGIRGSAVVIDISPISPLQRYSVTEAPTVNITVAAAQFPGGVRVDQKVPAGQYQVGQTVPVLQDPKNPHKVFLDRPDLERSALAVYSPLGMAALTPLIVLAAITGGGTT